MHIISKEQLFELLQQGAVVLTPNNRLSAFLLKQYYKKCGESTLAKPHCIPYKTYLSLCYNALVFKTAYEEQSMLLTDNQCRFLWEDIISKTPGITYSAGLQTAVMKAWEQCELWRVSPTDPNFNHTHQTKQFQQWWQSFNKRLKELKAITPLQLVPFLINQPILIFDKPIIWACFDEYTPQQKDLQEFCNSKAVPQYAYDLPESIHNPCVYEAKDSQEEYQELILWLKEKLEKKEENIGVVIPELAQESSFVQRLLNQHFQTTVYNLSLGQSLSSFPLVAHAFFLLDLSQNYVSNHQAAILLQSPYIAGAKEEFLQRSQYLQDALLMEDQGFSMEKLSQELQNHTPILATLLQQCIPFPDKATPEQWVQLMHQRLNLFAFPGDYSLSSENYQCYNRFVSLFDELCQLSLFRKELSSTEALHALKQCAEHTIFQPQKLNASIHISGILEASGCAFDSLWVKGLNDQCLPQKTQLSAFIPPNLQKNLMMPHSLPSRELHFAKQTIQRLARGSAKTVFSFAHLEGDTPNLPCSLIKHFPDYKPIVSNKTDNTPPKVIKMNEPYQVAIKDNEKLSGGTALLANQAKCPFKAFAEHRLKAKASPMISDGLDNKEKGQLIHKVMELIWKSLGSQEMLMHLSSKELDRHIEVAIDKALTPIRERHPAAFSKLLTEIEFIRLKRLVLCCLDWEKKRPPFSVFALEQTYSIALAGMDFKVRVDRIDQVGDAQWVIDYKTTLPSSKPWNEERPKEPQLLLYALLDEHIDTLVLMQVKTGNILCSGLSAKDQEIRGISTIKKEERWEHKREAWHEQLSQLAEEFQQGHCPPEPASSTICQQCDFQGLCRFQVASI